MEPEVRERFEKIEADLQETAVLMKDIGRRMDLAEKRMDRAERLAEQNHRKAMERMDRAERLAEQNHRKAMERMDRFDLDFRHKLDVTSKVVAAGIKMVSRLEKDTRELKKAQKAFLESFRNGRNGGTHRS